MPFGLEPGQKNKRGGKKERNNEKLLEPVQELLEERLSCIVLPLRSPVSVRMLLMDRSVRVGWSVLSQNGGPRRSSFSVMDEFGWKLSEELRPC